MYQSSYLSYRILVPLRRAVKGWGKEREKLAMVLMERGKGKEGRRQEIVNN
jgi:hypothetical protein